MKPPHDLPPAQPTTRPPPQPARCRTTPPPLPPPKTDPDTQDHRVQQVPKAYTIIQLEQGLDDKSLPHGPPPRRDPRRGWRYNTDMPPRRGPVGGPSMRFAPMCSALRRIARIVFPSLEPLGR
jgi:hypothetical protein